MQVWCFVNPDNLWALSSDEAGDCLPPELGPWTFRKTAMLGGIDDDERTAQDLIRQHGFCCFDPKLPS
jgi:hypothetical protein